MKWATGLRVLIVNDEPEFTAALQAAFADLGFEIEVAIDAEEAISRILGRVPHLVCVNLNLPRGSGYDVCDLIRGDRSLEGVLILMTSDRHWPEDIAYAEEAGANAFLRLPVTPRDLAERVEALFEGHRPSSSRMRELRPSHLPTS